MTNAETIQTILQTSSRVGEIIERLNRVQIQVKMLNTTPSGVGGIRKWSGIPYMQISAGKNLYSKAFFAKLE